MKVLAKPVDMLCWFEKTGIPHPVRFKILNEVSAKLHSGKAPEDSLAEALILCTCIPL